MRISTISLLVLCAGLFVGASTATATTTSSAQALTERLAAAEREGQGVAVWRSYTDAEREKVTTFLRPASIVLEVGGRTIAEPGCSDKGPGELTCVSEWFTYGNPEVDLQVGSIESTRSFDNCWGPIQAKIIYKNLAGMRMFGYFLDVNWCSRNGKITEFHSFDSPQIWFPFWRFREKIVNEHPRSQDDRVLTKTVVGRFEACLEIIGCVQQATPKIQFEAVAGGSWSWKSTG